MATTTPPPAVVRGHRRGDLHVAPTNRSSPTVVPRRSSPRTGPRVSAIRPPGELVGFSRIAAAWLHAVATRAFGRRSIRLPGFDYSSPGAYFITLCTFRRRQLLAAICGDRLCLTRAGQIVRDEWLRSAEMRSDLSLDAFVVMPDHFHGIVLIGNGSPSKPASRVRGSAATTIRGPASGSIGAVLAGFKAATTVRINGLRQLPGEPVWQRNYFECVIRDQYGLRRVRAYIEDNPVRWIVDARRDTPTR